MPPRTEPTVNITDQLAAPKALAVAKFSGATILGNKACFAGSKKVEDRDCKIMIP